jgi:S-adenosylmethionine:tRNA ribosyltransferase-isomerase
LSVDDSLRVEDFDYHLPEELIAQTPLEQRDRSRMLVVRREDGSLTDDHVASLPDYLRPGDLLVRNNSQVIAARFWARKADTQGGIELLLLRSIDGNCWEALAKPAKRLQPGVRAEILTEAGGEPIGATFDVNSRGDQGLVTIQFSEGALERLDQFGTMPLPPYIHTRLADANRYQTLYASTPGSAGGSHQ